jgi:hypothetical protein
MSALVLTSIVSDVLEVDGLVTPSTTTVTLDEAGIAVGVVIETSSELIKLGAADTAMLLTV